MSEYEASTEEEKAFARTLMNALEPFRALSPTMTLQYVYTFLLVVSDEGLGVNEYAHKAGDRPNVMTRHLHDLGDQNRYGGKGFGLVARKEDSKDRRKHRSTVTPVGKELMKEVIRALQAIKNDRSDQ